MHIVTGMHRSGTSFLAQAFHLLGANFGATDRLFSADFWNQKGYFESIDVVDINNRLILGHNATVDFWLTAPESGLARARNSFAARKWKYFFRPSVARIDARSSTYDGKIRELHEIYRGCYVKDPRFCLALGSWVSRGPVEGLVFSFRDPWAVAASIKRREGLPLVFGYQQWLYHVRNFWAQVPSNLPVFLVDFDQFFDMTTQGQAFERLARYMKHTDLPTQSARLMQALDIRLRHHKSAPGDMPKAVAQAYEALRSMEASGRNGVITPQEHETEIAAIAPGTVF